MDSGSSSCRIGAVRTSFGGFRPDGSGVRQVTDAPNGAWSFNQWSPDGSMLVFDDQITGNMFLFDPRKPWADQRPQVVSERLEDGTFFSPFSWSPDETQLLGEGGPEDPNGMLYLYSFASKRFTRVSDVGSPWGWLNDGRRLLYTHHRSLFVLDTASKSARELLSVAPDDFESVALSADNRTIYFTREARQSDIWMMTLR